MREIIKISDIKIPKHYKKPQENKLNICRNYFITYGKIDRDIIVDSNNTIKDGYVGYLVLKENGVKNVEVVKENGMSDSLYVYAHHRYKNKLYVWKVTNKTKNIHNLSVGSKIIVDTKNGAKLVIVDKFSVLNNPPVLTPIREVIRCMGN